jgi:glutathione S-transferase
MNRPATFDLQVSRFIRAPREKVFDAFVTRQGLAAWMGPRSLTVPEASVDARVGGRYRVVMRARDGSTYVVGGVYRELARPERLVFTWRWEGADMPGVETLVTVRFAQREGGTQLTVHHTGFPDAGMRDSHGQGWNSSLNKLIDLLDERGSAATVTLLGDPCSTYTRTARMGLAEKGVKYTMQQTAPRSAEILSVHPFGKVPGFRDGDFELFETSAILRYLDESFDGTPLIPGMIRERARCEQWVSAINAYCYDAMIRRYVLQYVFPRGADGKPERGAIDAALEEIPGQLAIFDRAYGEHDFLVGNAVCMADLFLAPILAYVEAMPEGAALLAAVPKVKRAQTGMRARPSFQETEPPRG